MKICFASQSFYPHIGGVSTYLLNLARGLQRHGHEVVEVHLRPPHEESEEVVKGVQVYRVPKEPLDRELLAGYSRFKESVYKECHGQNGAFDKEVPESDGYKEYNEINEAISEQVGMLLEKRPAEIVHIHDFQLLFLYRNVPRGTPLILTWHIPFSTKMSVYLKGFLIKHMQEFDRVIFSSQEYIDAAVDAGLAREKAVLIHPIANTEIFKPMDADGEFRERYHLPENARIILCVQRIDAKCGHEQLIGAMPKILKEVPEARLVFVGGQSLSGKIAKDRLVFEKRVKDLIKELNLSDYVVFTGNIEYTDVPIAYNSADVVALTSKNEGFGLSVTEGMACGKPVVGTNVGGIPIQIKDGVNGFLVGVGDTDATADRIACLLKDADLRKRMGDESLKIVKERFQIEVGVEKHIKLYSDLLKEKGESWSLRMLKLGEVEGLITDYDRTLTDKPGEVRPAVIRRIKSIKKPLILSTGRTLEYVKALCESYRNVWRCVVAENGAVIYFPKTKKTITIKSPYSDEARRLIANSGLKAVFGEVVISVPLTEKKRVKEALKGLGRNVSYKINVDELMILPANVDKCTGTRIALQYLRINPEKTVIVADGQNDVDLFNVPGFRVAVANAHRDLKNLADQVTKKPCSEGLIEVIEELKK